MKLSGTVSATSWRVLVAVAIAAFLGVSVGASARPQAATPGPGTEPAAQSQDDPLKFSRAGRMLIVYQLKPGVESDFALAWRTIKDHLGRMGDPALSSFAQSLNIHRIETPAGGPAIFIFDLDPVSTVYSYNPVTLLYETLKEDEANPGLGLSYDQATEIYDKIKDAYTSITPWPLTPVR